MPELPRPEGYRRVARLMSALAGGAVATAADLRDVAAIERRWPGTAAQIRAARVFHSRAAARAVSGGARGLIVCPVGYPCPPDPHVEALRVMPSTRVVLAEPDEEAAMVAVDLWGGDGRVRVVRSAASDAAGLMAAPEVRSLPGPLCLMLPWVLSLLCPEDAATVIAEYSGLLPAGSLVVASWWSGACDSSGDGLVRAWRLRVGPGWGHAARDVEAWLKAAGMEVLRRPMDVRVRRGAKWAEAEYAGRPTGRMIAAVARVR